MSNTLKLVLEKSVFVLSGNNHFQDFAITNLDNSSVVLAWSSTNGYNPNTLYSSVVNFTTSQPLSFTPYTNSALSLDYPFLGTYSGKYFISFIGETNWLLGYSYTTSVIAETFQASTKLQGPTTLSTDNWGIQQYLSGAQLSSNQFFLTFSTANYGFDGNKIYGQILAVSSTANTVSYSGLISFSVSSSVTVNNPVVAYLGSNIVAEAWIENRVSDGLSNIMIQTYTVGGSLSSKVMVNPQSYACSYSGLAIGYTSGIIEVAFTATCSGKQAVYGQYLSNTLVKKGGMFQISASTDTAPSSPQITVTQDSRFLSTYQAGTGSCAVNGQLYNPVNLVNSTVSKIISNSNCVANSYVITALGADKIGICYQTSDVQPLIYCNRYKYTQIGTGSFSFSHASKSDSSEQTASVSPSGEQTVTITGSLSDSDSNKPTASASPSGKQTFTTSGSLSNTKTNEQTATTSGSLTGSDSNKPTATITISGTPTGSISRSKGGPGSKTTTLSRSPTQTISLSPTPTLTITKTKSITTTESGSRSKGGPGSKTTTLSRSPTQTLSLSPTLTHTFSLTRTRTVSESGTPSTTVSPSPTVTPTPSGSETSSPSGTKTVTESVTTSPTPTPSTTVTASPTDTASPSGSETGSPSGTKTVTESVTPSPTPTPSTTVTASPTVTPTPSGSESVTPSTSVTKTLSLSNSGTPSQTVSPSPTFTVSDTYTIQCEKFVAKVMMYIQNIRIISADTSSSFTYTKTTQAICQNNANKEAKCSLDLKLSHPNTDTTTAFHDFTLKNEFTIDGSKIFIDNDCTGKEVIAQLYNQQGYIYSRQQDYEKQNELIYNWNTTTIPRSYCASNWNKTDISEKIEVKVGPKQCTKAILTATFVGGIKLNYQADVKIFGHDKFGNQLVEDALTSRVNCLIKHGIGVTLIHGETEAVFTVPGIIIHDSLKDVTVTMSGCSNPGDVNTGDL